MAVPSVDLQTRNVTAAPRWAALHGAGISGPCSVARADPTLSYVPACQIDNGEFEPLQVHSASAAYNCPYPLHIAAIQMENCVLL